MIKAVLFDFDGVILESADIKSEAFRELFKEYPQELDEIMNYHVWNGGISRYVKFRYIYEQILKREFTEERETQLGEFFSRIVVEKILQTPFVPGAKEFFDKNKNQYKLFVVSGTPEDELLRIIHGRELQEYFKEIHGSPAKKTDIVNGIMRRHGFSKEDLAFVGDAESDRVAAGATGVAFIERKSDLESGAKPDGWMIRDLIDLERILADIDLQNDQQ